ncbi:bifunctional demethylmenaquinone methyltransferase/2-methoxy-6-polyprenyl-1,4-benzoquinol methylase UbiE [bacterium]|nr:MAG: bifunctional demethylmenaquinone methyltransferase/2-methoxy-6-polyprenyl-1,4-benzoquinol methylase UbiE [bacterium]
MALWVNKSLSSLDMPETKQQPESVRSESDTPAWNEGELDSLHSNADKHDKVQAMFNAIAQSYDLNNRVHSLWRDQAWRKRAVVSANVQPGEAVLDCACGTGDLTQAFAKGTQAERIVGSDFTAGMLEIAEHKRSKLHQSLADRIEYLQADAQALPFEDESFDVVSIAFGIRNVQTPEKAIGEFYRVLRPGGRLIILEFGQPSFAPMRWFNNFYCGTIMPRTATWIARDTSGAYKYLPRSVASFKTQTEMKTMMGDAGFGEVSSRSMTMGICNLYRGVRS